MENTRIIASVVVLDGMVVQSLGFNKYLPIGKPDIIVENLNRWGADEIIVSDISPSRLGRESIDFEMFKKLSSKSFTPLTAAGGIKSIDDVDKLLHSGADKIAINSSLFQEGLLEDISNAYGNQCLVGALDVKRVGNAFKLFLKNGKEEVSRDLEEILQEIIERGVGELFVNSIDRDGSKKGFDFELSNFVSKKVSVPMILCGGANSPEHFIEALEKARPDALCAGNMFSFIEHAIPIVKSAMIDREHSMRVDTFYKYSRDIVNNNGRLDKYDEKYLEDLMYLPPTKEEI